jgi:hypothetical protein
MIQLSFHNELGATAAVVETADLRISAGVLWSQREDGLIASYADGLWKHRGRYYPRVYIMGACCLLFGIARDPSFVSDPIGLFSFTGPTFRANGVAVAEYMEPQEMWHGLIRPIWWKAMRVITAATALTLVDESHVVILNPWDPRPEARPLVRTSTDKSPKPPSTSLRANHPERRGVKGPSTLH